MGTGRGLMAMILGGDEKRRATDGQVRGRRRPSSGRIERISAILLVVWGLVVVFVGTRVDSLSIPLSILRIDGSGVALAGTILAVAGGLGLVRPGGWTVSLVMLSAVGSLAMGLTQHPPRRGDRELSVGRRLDEGRIWTSPVDWYERYTQSDPYLGFHGIPFKASRHRHRDFDVVYTHGEDGYRVMPRPRSSRTPEILFLGCSMTFGIGVNDEDTFAYQLARHAWPGYRVRNLSCSGWGTTHACLALEKALQEGSRPALVIYAFFPGHLMRNYLRESWHQGVHADFPLFDEHGDFHGLRGYDFATLPDSPALDEAEARVTRGVIARMERDCRRLGVPMVVVDLCEDREGRGRRALDGAGVEVIDVSDAYYEHFPNDGHPTPFCHRRLARAIACEPRLAEIAGRPDLYQPAAFRQPMPEESQFRFRAGQERVLGQRRMAEVTGTSRSVAVDRIEGAGDQPEDMTLSKFLPAVDEGQQMTLAFRARAKTPRRLHLSVRTAGAIQEPIWAGASLELATYEQQFRFSFTADRPLPESVAVFSFGGDASAFVLLDFQVVQDGSNGTEWTVEGFPLGQASGAVVEMIPGPSSAWRFDRLVAHESKAWNLQIHGRGVDIQEDREYLVTGRIRSDRPRTIRVCLKGEGMPPTVASTYATVETDGRWRTFAYRLRALRNVKKASLTFEIGETRIPFELADVRVSEE